jgi:hypothetical protein
MPNCRPTNDEGSLAKANNQRPATKTNAGISREMTCRGQLPAHVHGYQRPADRGRGARDPPSRPRLVVVRGGAFFAAPMVISKSGRPSVPAPMRWKPASHVTARVGKPPPPALCAPAQPGLGPPFVVDDNIVPPHNQRHPGGDRHQTDAPHPPISAHHGLRDDPAASDVGRDPPRSSPGQIGHRARTVRQLTVHAATLYEV